MQHNTPSTNLALAREAFAPFMDLLSRVTLARDAQATHATLDDVRGALRFVRRLAEPLAARLRAALGGELPARAPAAELERLLAGPAPQRELHFAPEIGELMMTVFVLARQDDLRPYRIQDKALRTARTLSRKLEQAAAQVPGQLDAARHAAQDLALQLMEPRDTPARLMLHGPEGCGTAQMAERIAQALVTGFGYQRIDFDLATIREPQEAGLLDGVPSFWSNARPGLITSALYEHPRTVVVFFNADRSFARAVEPLGTALATGVMVDNHGLGFEARVGRGNFEPTPVNCSRAVFIFTAAEGSVWYRHPDMGRVLGSAPADVANTMREALRQARRPYRGDSTAVFDPLLLTQVENHLVLLRPLQWAPLLDRALEQLRAALDKTRQRLKLTSLATVAEDERRLAALHLLSQGSDAGVEATEAESILRNLLALLPQAAIAGTLADDVQLRLDDAARVELDRLLERGGANPLRALQRRRQVLRFESRMADGGTLSFGALRPHAAQRLSDYMGDVRLEAVVPSVTLDDVAGHAKAKAFLREMRDYLRDPHRVRALGIDLPRGALLYGPPGTGKTLLAQAFAGEAELPLVAVAGTDLLVPDRIRELYAIAKSNCPCVVFIDEVDVLGVRGQSMMHDAAINKLLTEIGGFSSSAPVFHILATNRADAIDPALTRSGRIDRSFFVGPLDREGRAAMVERIAALCEPDPRLRERLLSQSYAMTGAELEHARRECGLRLLRTRRERLSADEAIDELNRVKHGDHADRRADPAFRERLAVHEVGHAIMHHVLLPETEIAQISIAPREGNVAGFVAINSDGAPTDETPARVKAYLAVTLAGREAERIRYGDEDGRSAGASSDLAMATRAAYMSVALAGLDGQFGAISLRMFARMEDVPSHLSGQVWERVRAWIDEAAAQAERVLREHDAALRRLVELLLEREVIEGAEFVKEMAGRAAVADVEGR